MNKRVYISFLIICGISFGAKIEVSKSTFIFCLKPNVLPLSINKVQHGFETDLNSINSFIEKNKIRFIEEWMPYANDNDFDGDVYLNRIYRVYLNNKSNISVEILIDDISRLPEVLYAESEYKRKPFYTPNDTNLNQQCSIESVKADKAWDFWDIASGLIPGDRDVVLASVDTGVDYTHPDLWKNSWINQGEIPSFMWDSGIDSNNDGKVNAEEVVNYLVENFGDINSDGEINLRDAVSDGSPFEDNSDGTDGNGYPDDILGYDMSGTWGQLDNDPYPKEGATNNGTWAHGTHVAGVLAATTDNDLGMASTSFNTSFISVKASHDGQSGEPGINDGYQGILYAAKAGYYMGCPDCNPTNGDESPTYAIINNSWGGGGFLTSENSTINTAHNTYGAIIFCAAGNGEDDGWQEEYSSHYPSSYENSIGVCAIGCSGQWGNWATYHPDVDLAAPGESIYSAIIGEGYESWDGSSMASPNAASVAGLVLSFYPDLTNIEVRERLETTADRFIYELNPDYEICNGYTGEDCLGHGMVDAYKAIGGSNFPSLVVDSLIIDDALGDSDGISNPGETFNLDLLLSNETGWQVANNLNMQLSCSDENIEVNNSTSFTGVINPNDNGQTTIPFTLTFSEGSIISESDCIVNLTGSGIDGASYNYYLPITLNISLSQSGYPLYTGFEIKGSPIVFDIDDDGVSETFVMDGDGLLHHFTSSGTEVDNDTWPFDTGNENWGSPAADDIDNDGYIDLIVGSKSNHLFVFDKDGLKLDYDADSYLMGSPALGQLDGDDDLEIVIGGYSSGNKKLYAVNVDGSDVTSFPVDVGEKILRGVALYDFNNNGIDDIVFGTDSDNIILLYDDGTIAWSYQTGDRVQGAPSIINTPSEILICAGSRDNSMYCLNQNGELEFSISTGGRVDTSPSAVDIDTGVAIFFGSDDGFIYAVDTEGTSLTGWPIDTGSKVVGSIAFSDVDGDQEPEVISSNEDGYVLAYHLDGTTVTYFPILNPLALTGSPHIVDTDNDGDLEVLVGSMNELVGMDIKTSGSTDGYWSTHRSNKKRNGYWASSHQPDCTSGDVNDNSIIDILDIMQVVAIIMDTINPSNMQNCAADADANGEIDILDVMVIINIIMSQP